MTPDACRWLPLDDTGPGGFKWKCTTHEAYFPSTAVAESHEEFYAGPAAETVLKERAEARYVPPCSYKHYDDGKFACTIHNYMFDTWSGWNLHAYHHIIKANAQRARTIKELVIAEGKKQAQAARDLEIFERQCMYVPTTITLTIESSDAKVLYNLLLRQTNATALWANSIMVEINKGLRRD